MALSNAELTGERSESEMKKKLEFQYYYKRDGCKAKDAEDGDCICWHDEGTGPYKDERHSAEPPLVNWRIKPSNAGGMTTPQTDRELLELAAKAAGIDGSYFEGVTSTHTGIYRNGLGYYWNPLISDSEALRLAVKLKIRIGFRPCAYADTPAGLRFFGAHDGDDQFSRTRLAVVRAAAAIGQAMP